MNQSAPMQSDEDGKIVRTTVNYKNEARQSKLNRMILNRENFDCYHLRADWSHKKSGQSKEFLPKQAMSVEQIVSFFQQGLVDMGDWFRVERELGVTPAKDSLTQEEIQKIVNRQLEKCSFVSNTGDALKLGLLGAVMITKVHGGHKDKITFFTEKTGKEFNKDVLKRRKDRVWNLAITNIRQEDYYPDPTGKGVYELEEMYMDMAEIYALADGDDAIFDIKEVDKLASQMANEEEQKLRRARETAQNVTTTNFRKRVKLTEGWGNIIDPDSGRILHKNVVWTMANDSVLLRRPEPNPFWHGRSPYVATPIIRVPFSVWHKALMDAPTRLNQAENELFNLILDAGMMDAHGIKQLRVDWLEDEREVSEGIPPATTLKVNSQCPPGGKVLERVDTSSMSTEAISVLNIISQEYNQSALTNDLRMGVLPARAVKATEVVEASQTITSVFTGLAKVLEQDYIEKLLDLSWITILQHMDDMDQDEIRALIGDDRTVAVAAISNEERFSQSALGHKFKVFGVTQTLSKMKDFRKLTSLLQTIGGSDPLMEEFIKKYDMGKLLGEIMRTLDVNVERIKQDEGTQIAMAMSQPGGAPGASQQGIGPNMQSQIRQVSTGPREESLEGNAQSAIPHANFDRPGIAGGLS